MKREALGTTLNLINKTLDIPIGCYTSASYIKNIDNNYIELTFRIPLDNIVPLIQKWNGWKNAYKHRKR